MGCNTIWKTAEVCDQRNRIHFAGVESEFAQPDCESFDFDDDGISARYDIDDRLNRYDPDAGIDGSNIGEIRECVIVYTDDVPRQDTDPVYNEECIQGYWGVQLTELCAAWLNGDMSPFEENNLDAEEVAAQEFCF